MQPLFNLSNAIYLSVLVGFFLSGILCVYTGKISSGITGLFLIIGLCSLVFSTILKRWVRLLWLSLSVFLLSFTLYNHRYRDILNEFDKLGFMEIKRLRCKILEVKGFKKDKFLILTRLKTINGLSINGHYELQIKSYIALTDFHAGDLIDIFGKVVLTSSMLESSYRTYLANKYIVGRVWIYKTNQLIRVGGGKATSQFHEKILSFIHRRMEKNISYPSSTLSFALISGDKNKIPEEIKEDFRKTGTYHMLAVSGMHAGIIFLIFYSLLRFLGFRKLTSTGTILFLIFPWYLFITNFQISIVRTYIMMTVGFFLPWIGRTFDPLRLLFFTIIVVLLVEPNELFSISFQLSFSAIFGILLSLKIIKGYEIKNRAYQYIWVSLGAQLFTAPFLIYYFGYINYFTIFYNLLISFILFLSLIITVLFLFSPSSIMTASLGNTTSFLNNLIFHILHKTRYDFSFFNIEPGNLLTCICLFLAFLAILLWIINKNWPLSQKLG